MVSFFCPAAIDPSFATECTAVANVVVSPAVVQSGCLLNRFGLICTRCYYYLAMVRALSPRRAAGNFSLSIFNLFISSLIIFIIHNNKIVNV